MTTFTQEQSKEALARKELKRLLPAEALVDDTSRGIYATDASIYEFPAIAVATPRNEEELRTIHEVATACDVPLLPRGGGTSLAGQATNRAIVVDMTKHMNQLLEINPEEKWARVQPGLVRDELNAALKEHNLEFAPETSTSNRAVIAGMIGNNSSGMRSVRYKRTIDHLLGGRVMLTNREIIDCVDRSPEEAKKIAEQDTPEGKLWKKVIPIIEENRAFIEERFPKVMRRVGGYSLDEFPPEGPWNLMKLVAGSEGTLATILEAKLNLVERPPVIGMVTVHFKELLPCFSSVPDMLKHDPLSIELMDGRVVELSKNNPSTQPLCDFIEGDPQAILVVELTGDSVEDMDRQIDAFIEDMKSKGHGYAWPSMRGEEDRGRVIELRKRSLGVLLGMRGDLKPIPFIEDMCVPPDVLGEYLEKVVKIVRGQNLDVVMFGHASVGVIHVRPVVNQKLKEHVDKMEIISSEVMKLVKEYGGSWSGEHGDGIARGAKNTEFWGEKMIGLFRDVKAIFDPKGIMNPGRVFDTPPMNENLRFGPDYKTNYPDTYFRFKEFQGFGKAVEMCNGVGACRKTGSGTMCPSYMATRDESATTRGRANALRLAIAGKFGDNGLVSEGVHEALDLCLECKACKTECPSNVDMSRMKSEHLAHYHATHGATMRDRVFAEAPTTGKLLSGPIAGIANAFSGIGFLRKMGFGVIGIAKDRDFPQLATQPLTSWFEKNAQKNGAGAKGEVVLFGDCWANYYETEAGQYATRLLEKLGYQVTLVVEACCQRTRISKGFLKKAKEDGAKTVSKLKPYAERGVPILAIEPSCCSSVTDDLTDLVANEEDAKIVAEHAHPIEQFLAAELAANHIDWPKPEKPFPKYLVHGHCHQKALYSTVDGKSLLRENTNAAVSEVDSGCCGMAGSFGYEQEHFELSKKLANQRLLPAVNSTKPDDTIVIANGFSCRHQIKDFSGRKAYHIIEALGRGVFGEWE